MWVGLQPRQKQKQGSPGQGVPNNLLFWLPLVSGICPQQSPACPRSSSPSGTKMYAPVTMSLRVGARGRWGVPLFLSSLATKFAWEKKLGYI